MKENDKINDGIATSLATIVACYSRVLTSTIESLWQYSIFPFNVWDYAIYFMTVSPLEKWSQQNFAYKLASVGIDTYLLTGSIKFIGVVDGFVTDFNISGQLCYCCLERAEKSDKVVRHKPNYAKPNFVITEKKVGQKLIQKEIILLDKFQSDSIVARPQKRDVLEGPQIQYVSENIPTLRVQLLRPKRFEQPTYISTGQPPGGGNVGGDSVAGAR